MPVTYSYAVDHQLPLDEQDEAVWKFWESRQLPNWGDCHTPDQRFGHIVDLDPLDRMEGLAYRREGGRLFNLLQRGDHVVFCAVRTAFRKFDDWQSSLELWSKLGVTSHYIEEGLTFEPGARLLVAMQTYGIWRHAIQRRQQALHDLAKARGIPIPEKLIGMKAELERFAERTSPPTFPLPGRVFSYLRTCEFDADLGAPPLVEQDRAVRSVVRAVAGSVPDVTIGRLTYENTVRTAEYRLLDRPAARRMMQQIRPGDHLVVHSAEAAFRSTADLVTTLEFLRGRGAVLHFADCGISTDGQQGRELVNAFGILMPIDVRRSPLSVRKRRPDLLPSYLFKETINGKAVIRYDEAAAQVARGVRKLVRRNASVNEIADKLEELDAARFDDGLQIPRKGFRSDSEQARRLAPGHGQRWGTRLIVRRWRLAEVRLMQSPDYFKQLERTARDYGFSRSGPWWRWSTVMQ